MKIDFCVSPHTKIISEWITDLNIRPETINYIDCAYGSWSWRAFYEFGPKAREVKAKTND